MNAHCWALHIAAPYFRALLLARCIWPTPGRMMTVRDIPGRIPGAYQYIGGNGPIKRVTMAQPVFQTTGPLTVAMGVMLTSTLALPTAPVSSFCNRIAMGAGVWGTGHFGAAA